jgi:hypothetical protein
MNVRRVFGLAAIGLLVAAVARELRTPSDERSWQGRVLGVVPYDLRLPPTPERVKAAWWSPDDERLITPQPIGVGWVFNIGRVARLAGLA